MARFRKGTTDHDGDGRMGGSMKETDMAKKNTAAKKADEALATNAPKAEKKAAVEEQFAEADAKADPELTEDDIEAMQVGLQVRGY